MAIKNQTTNEYLKVTGIQLDIPQDNYNIVYLIFADAEQRKRYESGLTQYEQYQSGQFNSFGFIETALKETADNEITIFDNLMSACYSALKADMFKDWIDC